MRALMLMGPTASGKSALALRLAGALDGEILNADSMQAYRDWRVLTARPTAEDGARVPHHLYGHIDAAERYSVGRWLAQARTALTEIAGRGKTPIVTGGTGLYFKALCEGLAETPPIEPEIEADLRARLAAEGPAALHARLVARDPESAVLSPQDGPRIVRALAVLEATGQPLSAWRAAQAEGLPREAWAGLCLTPDRDALYARIDARFAAMMAAGALEEAKAVAARALDPDLPAMKAHGAPHLLAHLRGELALEAAVARAQQDTRRYAKRQFTWMRGQMADWAYAAPEDGFDAACRLWRMKHRDGPINTE
ncbi:MAG: tRNA (adenosine(37)-N6)-dimethylallyltransferase MiaA [Alphaproteobacteria bacterium]|nr:tRNA (adenosine(37)-N6)-dimethylallyltransferase MiaA [Alphaproteobacteria bacterium]